MIKKEPLRRLLNHGGHIRYTFLPAYPKYSIPGRKKLPKRTSPDCSLIRFSPHKAEIWLTGEKKSPYNLYIRFIFMAVLLIISEIFSPEVKECPMRGESFKKLLNNPKIFSPPNCVFCSLGENSNYTK